MLLRELFDTGGDLLQQLRQEALNFITPLMGQDIPFVTVQQVIDTLSNDQFGIVINRPLVMKILDPDQVKAIGKIEGDRIYLQKPEEVDREVDIDDKVKDQEHVKDTAQQQAKKNVAEK